jgi:hypothetical protein
MLRIAERKDGPPLEFFESRGPQAPLVVTLILAVRHRAFDLMVDKPSLPHGCILVPHTFFENLYQVRARP